MNADLKRRELLFRFMGQAVPMCMLTVVAALVAAALYGAAASVWHFHDLGVGRFLPSGRAWEAAVLLGLVLALFNVTGDSVEIDCDQGCAGHSAVTYGLALATTVLFALGMERATHGTWLAPYFQSWFGVAVVILFLATKLVAMRWHRKTLTSAADSRMPAD